MARGGAGVSRRRGRPLDPDSRERGVEAATDIGDPNASCFFERYEDADAFEFHGESDHFQAFETGLADLPGDEPEVDPATALDQ